MYVIGVDVGSRSVRAGLFSIKGKMIANATKKIKIRQQGDFVEQSSEDIWEQTCYVIKDVIQQSKISKDQIKGIAFDATCSLVALDKNDNPVGLGLDKDPYWNIIMWMDHRASTETKEINDSKHKILKYVGNQISIEMEIPKIMWIKKNLNDQYKKIAKFFDLADFLQYKLSNSEIRSSCTVTCKWNFLAHENRWDNDFLKQCDLEDLLKEEKIGTEILPPGSVAGTVSPQMAELLGLSQSTVVGVGMIDAHAGGLGSLGVNTENSMTIIAGTSACHMLNTRNPYFVSGVWGPYYGAMIPDLWLNEGGQSAAGALLDYVIQNHVFYPQLMEIVQNQNSSPYLILNEYIDTLRKEDPYPTKELHILGYHHGNRSPRSDASLRGMVSGQKIDASLNDLALNYLAAVQSVCYGTRHILEECIRSGHKIERLVICGGATKNPLWLSELADITGYNIETPQEPEAVLLGSALIAAISAKIYPSIEDTANNMCHPGENIKSNPSVKSFHDKKYQVFLEMYKDQMKYRKIMN